MAPIDLSIIIVNWRSAFYTRQCLRTIYRHTGSVNFEIIVIDNASYDGCKEMLESEFPHVTFIQSERNLGFGGANNLAFTRSRGKHILFLNPDTEIHQCALQKLIAALEEQPDAGMAGARLLNSDCSLQTTSVCAPPTILNAALSSSFLQEQFPNWSIWGMWPLFTNSNRPTAVKAISGACMLAKRIVIEQVSGFTADFFMYSEDMDLCAKVTEAGWKIYYVPEATIVHHGGASSSATKESHFSSIMLRESHVRFMEIHRGRLYAVAYRAAVGVVAIFRLLLLIVAIPLIVYPRLRRRILPAGGKWLRILAWCFGFMGWAKRRQLLFA